MEIFIKIGTTEPYNREARVSIKNSELSLVHLHLAHPEKRNRTGLYMRRHKHFTKELITPNKPLISKQAPPKISISDHIKAMRRIKMLPTCTAPIKQNGEIFGKEPVMLAVPISDLVANLLRPCFHIHLFGNYKSFFFEDEPVDHKTYWCACFFNGETGFKKFELREVRFDVANDRVLDLSGNDLVSEGLIWAAAMSPLVIDSKPLSPTKIAQNDYDLRHILGRDEETQICYAYEGWYSQWDNRVKQIVENHESKGLPFASFYHSFLALDQEGNIHIEQRAGALPDIAKKLSEDGMVAAGLLDSGGSCAIYEVRMESYFNHNWYFREPRGSILVFELNSSERIPITKKAQ